jgi:hypothetical protein
MSRLLAIKSDEPSPLKYFMRMVSDDNAEETEMVLNQLSAASAGSFHVED